MAFYPPPDPPTLTGAARNAVWKYPLILLKVSIDTTWPLMIAKKISAIRSRFS